MFRRCVGAVEFLHIPACHRKRRVAKEQLDVKLSGPVHKGFHGEGVAEGVSSVLVFVSFPQ